MSLLILFKVFEVAGFFVASFFLVDFGAANIFFAAAVVLFGVLESVVLLLVAGVDALPIFEAGGEGERRHDRHNIEDRAY